MEITRNERLSVTANFEIGVVRQLLADGLITAEEASLIESNILADYEKRKEAPCG